MDKEDESIDDKVNTGDQVYSIVKTTRAMYFGIVKSDDSKVVIESAYEIPEKDKDDKHAIVKGYLKGRLYGLNRKEELSRPLVEGIREEPEFTMILKTYEALLPEAEKRAVGVMTYQALMELVNKTKV